MSVGSERLFHLISVKNPAPPMSPEAGFDSDDSSTRRFFSRFGPALDLDGKRVLDVGCGTGSTCIEAARREARRVVGIDLQLVEVARNRRRTLQPALADVIEFVETVGGLEELGGETFDVIFSKDSFEHYADPEHFVHVITRFLAPGGSLVIGFGPLWKAPFGGHIDYITRVPWAHLVFREDVVMKERRRFRPDERAERYEDIVGGLNKITLGRFRTIMSSSGLDCAFFATNVSDRPAVRVMKALSRIPAFREFLTINVYSIWRKPALPRDAPIEA
jgi:SAM-dependent methyltransferase